MHPTALREDRSGKLLSEVFRHVGTFEFPVYEHIDADFLLQPDARFDLLLDEAGIARFVPFALAPFLLASRTSAVCGKLPIVVVGSSGSPHRSRCSPTRLSTAARTLPHFFVRRAKLDGRSRRTTFLPGLA